MSEVIKFYTLNMCRSGTSLVVQGLRLSAPNAGGLGSIPGHRELDPTCHN